MALLGVLDAVLRVDPTGLAPEVAVARAEALLLAQDRLAAAGLRAVADVEARELWRERAAGSTRGWLQALPCGDRGQLRAARALLGRPLLGAALAGGSLALRTAVVVAEQLARVPARVERGQLEAVLVDGLGDLLRVWAGAACLDPTGEQETEFERRREQLAAAVRAGLGDCWSSPAGQLEPAFVLAAQVLAPAEVEAGVRLLVDALQPEPEVEAAAEREYSARGLTLRKLARGGWSLRAHLTDETGQLLHQALLARTVRHPQQPDPGKEATDDATPDRLADLPAQVEDVFGRGQVHDEDVFGRSQTYDEGESAGEDAPTTVEQTDADADTDTDTDTGGEGESETAPSEQEAPTTASGGEGAGLFGAVGPGCPVDAFGVALADPAVQGTPLLTRDQQLHDALGQLLADLADPAGVAGASPGSGAPARAHLTITAGLAALEGRAGAPPGRLRTTGGDVPLTPGRLRALVCGGLLSAVLHDARGRPVGASGTHRHATARERRVMHAVWGGSCAVNACALPGPVPHHADPFWLSRQTRQADLLPVCEHHHHDIHEGHKTLRLRDGRLVDEWGWVSADRGEQGKAG